jgi:hypothetical protein
MDLYTLQIFTPVIEATKEVDWLSYLTASLTPIVAGFGIWIARSQWKTARMKLKLDLFEKRIVVYDAVRNAMGEITTHGKPSAEVFTAYLTGIAGAKWLFDEKMHKYLSVELWGLISRLHVIHIQQIGASPNEKREAAEKQLDVLGEMHTHWENIDSRFYPFLGLSH